MDLADAKIARRTSRHRSTIMREFKRNGKLNQPALTALRKNMKTYNYPSKNAQNKIPEKLIIIITNILA